MSPPLLLLQSHFHHQLPRLPEKLGPACQQPLLQRQPSSPRGSPQTGGGGTEPRVVFVFVGQLSRLENTERAHLSRKTVPLVPFRAE